MNAIFRRTEREHLANLLEVVQRCAHFLHQRQRTVLAEARRRRVLT